MRTAARLLPFATALALVAPSTGAAQSESYTQLQTFSYLLDQVRRNYVVSVSTEALVRGAIEGMLRSLDPHSRFVPRAENERWLEWSAGRLAATGIVLDDEDGVPTVMAVRPGSAAARERILPGDRVLALNDTSVAGEPVRHLQLKLTGERGTVVRLRLARGPIVEPETVTVSVRNETERAQSVTTVRTLAPGLGYVRLAEFQHQAAAELRDAVQRATAGPAPRALVLDLRGNPGGDVQAAVDVAEEFLPKGTLVCRMVGRRDENNRDFRTTADGRFRDLRLAVLVDEHTASAAEILAGALQDHDRARIMGRRTFGKALVQRLYEVPPNGDAAWLTVAYVQTPSGRLIQRRYQGLSLEQYYTLAGRGGDAQDTLPSYRTDSGRTVRGGGGIEPDSLLPAPPRPPLWWSLVADSGLDYAVADSVAPTLPADAASRTRWLDAGPEWRTRLVEPLLARARARLRVTAAPDRVQAEKIAEILATRAAAVRWGADFADEFQLHNDSDVRAAAAALGRTLTTSSGDHK